MTTVETSFSSGESNDANQQPDGFIIIGTQPLGRFGQRPVLSQAIGMALHPGQVLRDSLPLLSPAFRLSHFRHQVPPRPPRRERS